MNGRRSIALRREWNDRHFMNREPSPIELSAASGRAPTVRARSTAAGGPTARALADDGSGPGGSDAPTEHGGARAGSAQLTYRDVSAGGGRSRHPPPFTASRSAREPACSDTDIRKSARDHYLANKLFVLLSKNIRVRRRALAARSPSRHGVAHANRFPAAGRLMRAGRAGAGGGSDARAHRHPSLSAYALPPRCERDHDNSLSQRRLVNTNRPRSRDKIFDLHFTTHTSACADRVATAPHTRALLANCWPPPPPRRCATFDNFSRKLTCTVTVDEARPRATWPPVNT